MVARRDDAAAGSELSLRRIVVAMLPPLLAIAVQVSLQPFFHPSVWFLAYPAVFVSSWIGGLRAAVVASAISAAAILWLVVPPERTWAIPAGQWLASGVFLATGVLFGVFHDRLRRASRQTAIALVDSERANDRLQRAGDAAAALLADLNRAQSVAGVGSWRLDVRRNELLWSEECYRIFGVAPGTRMTYEGFLACVHPDDRAFVDRAWSAALRGEAYDIEHRVVADGRVKWVREKADMELDAEGCAIGGIGITHDITERKRYEDALRKAQERVELALEGADLACWDWNVETGEAVFNARWAEMRGYRPDEVREHVQSWRAGIHPDDLPRVRRALDDYFEGRAAQYEVEHRARTKSGEWIWILDKGRIFSRDERGRPTRMVGTELDITVRKRAEEEHRLLAEVGAVFASSLRYDETLHTIAQLLVRELADFCIVDVVADGEVRRHEVVSRDPADAWIGRLFEELALDRSRPHLVFETLATGRSVLIERLSPERVRSFAQSEEHLRALLALDPKSVIVVPLLAHGKLLGAIALVSSTESRAYRESDLHLAEDLAVRAGLAIENARLYELAMRAVQARDDVVGIVAHDLRNPLGTIVMQAELLQHAEEEPGRGARRSGAMIARAARRMERLIHDLLDVTSIEAGGLRIEPRRVSTASVITDSLEAQRTLASSAEVEARCDVPAALPDVWGDRDRLLQVFENLIGNALKFTQPGGRITVGARREGGEVLFWVADTGAGIARDALPHVFDRFWQARRGERTGAGLGLSIVEGIVEAHGGRVWVESQLGRGTTFFFTIPTAPRAEQWRPEEASTRGT